MTAPAMIVLGILARSFSFVRPGGQPLWPSPAALPRRFRWSGCDCICSDKSQGPRRGSRAINVGESVLGWGTALAVLFAAWLVHPCRWPSIHPDHRESVRLSGPPGDSQHESLWAGGRNRSDLEPGRLGVATWRQSTGMTRARAGAAGLRAVCGTGARGGSHRIHDFHRR